MKMRRVTSPLVYLLAISLIFSLFLCGASQLFTPPVIAQPQATQVPATWTPGNSCQSGLFDFTDQCGISHVAYCDETCHGYVPTACTGVDEGNCDCLNVYGNCSAGGGDPSVGHTETTSNINLTYMHYSGPGGNPLWYLPYTASYSRDCNGGGYCPSPVMDDLTFQALLGSNANWLVAANPHYYIQSSDFYNRTNVSGIGNIPSFSYSNIFLSYPVGHHDHRPVVYPVADGLTLHVVGPIDLPRTYNQAINPYDYVGQYYSGTSGIKTLDVATAFDNGGCVGCMPYVSADAGGIQWPHGQPRTLQRGKAYIVWISGFPPNFELVPRNPGWEQVENHILKRWLPGNYIFMYVDQLVAESNIGYAFTIRMLWDASPLLASLSPKFSACPLHAPSLGLEAQTLFGHITGGTGAPYTTVLHVRNPGGVERSWTTDTTADLTIAPATVSDDEFGCDVPGQWTAWLEVTKGVQTVLSNNAYWISQAYPVIEAP
jgi:hypothetical protein